ncbi:hypothetical protein V6246_12545 [Algibacter sp. TI.3.09]|uniref:hypothetical protein n=1 Tax=Algibacter sp. TI.3.09 TaxID=3121298 RepID=UPI00311D75D2
MKHIKKKYYYQEKVVPVKNSNKGYVIDRPDSKTIKKIKKDVIPFIQTTDGFKVLSMFHNYNGTEVVIPIPDLTLVYNNNAYLNNLTRKEQEKKLFKKLLDTSEITEVATNELYAYIGVASSSIIQMFTSIESFTNHLIPDDQPYINSSRRDRTESYTKDQIQIHIKFWDKMKDVLPYFHSKNFFQKQTPTNSHITKLKELRDEIVHTKSNQVFESQSNLIEKLLKFKYDETLLAIRKFMNFYIPEYIVECDCNDDF